MFNNSTVFSDMSVEYLMSKGESAVVENGWNTITMSTMAPALRKTPLGNEKIKIPFYLNSAETLVFCGLRDNVVQMLYKRWYDSCSDPMIPCPPVCIYNAAIQYVEMAARYCSKANALVKEDDWVDALTRLGVNTECIGRIMNSQFEDLRLTKSAKEWTIETICMAWRQLISMNDRVQRVKGITAVVEGNQEEAEQILSELQAVNDLYNQGVPSDLGSATNLLFKGGSLDLLLPSMKVEGSRAQGIRNILSRGDFHPTESFLYFTTSRKAAIQDALYASHRVPLIEPGLMTVEVSPGLVKKKIVVCDPEWTKLVWASRNENTRFKNDLTLPKELEKYANAPVLVGFTCFGGNDHISKYESLPEHIPKRQVDGESLPQYAIRFLHLFEHSKEQKLHIKILKRFENL